MGIFKLRFQAASTMRDAPMLERRGRLFIGDTDVEVPGVISTEVMTDRQGHREVQFVIRLPEWDVLRID